MGVNMFTVIHGYGSGCTGRETEEQTSKNTVTGFFVQLENIGEWSHDCGYGFGKVILNNKIADNHKGQ